jgi:hypothetical protein
MNRFVPVPDEAHGAAAKGASRAGRLWSAAIDSATPRPMITASTSELDASRFAPCTPVLAASPIA